MTSVSAGHIILTPTQTVGNGPPQRESNPGSTQQESRALLTELPTPAPPKIPLIVHYGNMIFNVTMISDRIYEGLVAIMVHA